VAKLKGLSLSLSQEINKSTYAVEFLSSTPAAWKGTYQNKYSQRDLDALLELADAVASLEQGASRLREMRVLVPRLRNYFQNGFFLKKDGGGSRKQAEGERAKKVGDMQI
jgi:hypothetical protein